MSSPYFRLGASVGNLPVATYPEGSGLVAATRLENSSYFWGVQDSGATAVIVAINKFTAALAGSWTVTGASNIDWEDLTAFASLQKLIVGDVGNNANTLNSRGAGIDLILYRCSEPVITGSNGNIAAPDVEIIQCVFPAGDLPALRDVEAIFCDPLTGDVYLVTKRITPVKLYKLAYAVSYAGIQTLTFVTNLTADATFNTISKTVSGNDGYATGACISPNSKEIFIRSYDAIYYWKRNPATETIAQALARAYDAILATAYVGGGGGADNTVSTNRKFFHPTGEPQGESITLDQTGRHLYTNSEWVAGQADPVAGSFGRNVNPLFKYDRISRNPIIATFQQGVSPTAGYTGCIDTFNDEATPTQQNGAAVSLVMDIDFGVYPTITRRRQTLIKFDVSSIPTDAEVVSAFFEFYIGNEGKQIAFYPILEPWNAATITWANGGNILLYDNLNSSIFMYGTTQGVGVALDVYVGFCRINIPISLAQQWVSYPSEGNNGVMGTGGPEETTGDGLQIDSAESATAARRPKLTIAYIP